MMEVTRTSSFTGITRTLLIDVTQEQITAWLEGAMIQHAMPHLTPDEREFIMTGITADEWDSAFGEGE